MFGVEVGLYVGVDGWRSWIGVGVSPMCSLEAGWVELNWSCMRAACFMQLNVRLKWRADAARFEFNWSWCGPGVVGDCTGVERG